VFGGYRIFNGLPFSSGYALYLFAQNYSFYFIFPKRYGIISIRRMGDLRIMTKEQRTKTKEQRLNRTAGI